MTKTDEQKGRFNAGSDKGLGVSMPEKKPLTPKQEKFCQCIATGMNQTEAYRAVYDVSKQNPNSVNRNAHALNSNTKIVSRIKELAAPAIKEVGITVQEILENIIRIGKKAEDSDRFGEALKAQELMGKHLKMFTDQVLVGGTGVPIEINVRFIRANNI